MKLIDITPAHLRCIPASCPAVYEDGDEYVIIGKVVTPEQLAEVSGKVGPDEYVIRIGKAYLQGGEGTG